MHPDRQHTARGVTGKETEMTGARCKDFEELLAERCTALRLAVSRADDDISRDRLKDQLTQAKRQLSAERGNQRMTDK